MKFSFLIESLESAYEIPKDPELLLFDFYMLEFLDKGPNLRHGTPSSFTDTYLNKEEELKIQIDRIKKKLLPSLRQHLLEAVFESIKHEANNIEISVIFMNELPKEKNISPGEYLEMLRGRLKDLEKTPEKYVKLAETFFMDLPWKTSFGGVPWAKICLAWLELHECPYEELYIWIDHVYDIQHNTSTVFDKLDEYYRDGEEYEWIKKALNLKANLKTPWELFPNCSSDMKKLAAEVLTFKGHNLDKEKFVGAQSLAQRRMLFNQLILAINRLHLNTVKDVLTKVNVKELSEGNNSTLLTAIVESGSLPITKTLIEAGLKIPISAYYFLLKTAETGNFELVKYFSDQIKIQHGNRKQFMDDEELRKWYDKIRLNMPIKI